MPENCKSITLRDANNNTYTVPATAAVTAERGRGASPGGAAPKQRNIQVTAKVLFGSVHAINRLKLEEKAARENKRI